MATVHDEIIAGIEEAFDELESIAKSVTFHVSAAATYNTTTGAISRPKVDVALKGFVGSFKHHEIDGDRVRVGDKKLLVEQKDADAAAVAAGTTFGPKTVDRVTIGTQEHEVVAWSEDPASATATLTLRRAV